MKTVPRHERRTMTMKKKSALFLGLVMTMSLVPTMVFASGTTLNVVTSYGGAKVKQFFPMTVSTFFRQW